MCAGVLFDLYDLTEFFSLLLTTADYHYHTVSLPGLR